MGAFGSDGGMRITFVITNLGCGGAERIMSAMANYWAEKGWEVTLLTFDDGSTPPFFELDCRVRLTTLGIYQSSSSSIGAIWNNIKRIRLLRRAIRESRPDVVISFLYFVNILVLLATRSLGFPIIVSEHNDPLVDPIGRAWKYLRRWTYNFDARIVVLTERSRSYFPPKIRAKITVIPNPLPPVNDEINDSREIVLTRPALVAMGSFYRQKGFDMLLEAFALVKDHYPDWNLTIFGDGPLRMEIESLRDELGLSGRVHLPGLVKNPCGVFRQADLFVMSSRWEGWPTVLMEAMACGVPPVAFDCRTGPQEIIRDGLDGVLVPPEDVESLAAALDGLMSNESERRRLASNSVEVSERFALDKVMGIWEELLHALT